MLTILFIFCTLFAACLGSFSNVVIYRVPRRLSIAWPPSACPECGSRIKPYDNIPIFSWLFLRGKCRKCHHRISPQYVIVETVCAIFGALLCWQIFLPHLDIMLASDGVFWRLFLLFFSKIMFLIGCLALAIIDLQTTELPPEIALPIGGLGILTAFALPEDWPYTFIIGNISGMDAILGGLIGGGIILLIIGIYYALTRRIGMGGGDIWMMAMVGACLGWQCLPFIFLASSVQGIIAAAIAIACGRRQQTDTQNGLFRNAVADEIQPHHPAQDNASDANQLDISDDSNISGDAAEPAAGKLAVPYGPFIALAAIEYVFIGKYILPLISGGLFTPWGLMR